MLFTVGHTQSLVLTLCLNIFTHTCSYMYFSMYLHLYGLCTVVWEKFSVKKFSLDTTYGEN